LLGVYQLVDGEEYAAMAENWHSTDEGSLAQFVGPGLSGPKLSCDVSQRMVLSRVRPPAPHWPMAVREKTSTIYMNIISSQISYHTLMTEADMVFETLGFCLNLTRLVVCEDTTEFH
jgi:hypothetical protein